MMLLRISYIMAAISGAALLLVAAKANRIGLHEPRQIFESQSARIALYLAPEDRLLIQYEYPSLECGVPEPATSVSQWARNHRKHLSFVDSHHRIAPRTVRYSKAGFIWEGVDLWGLKSFLITVPLNKVGFALLAYALIVGSLDKRRRRLEHSAGKCSSTTKSPCGLHC